MRGRRAACWIGNRLDSACLNFYRWIYADYYLRIPYPLHTWRDLEFLRESDGAAKGPLIVRKRVCGSFARSLFQRGTKVYPRDATTVTVTQRKRCFVNAKSFPLKVDSHELV